MTQKQWDPAQMESCQKHISSELSWYDENSLQIIMERERDYDVQLIEKNKCIRKYSMIHMKEKD